MTQNKLHFHSQLKVKHITMLVPVHKDTQETTLSLSAESKLTTLVPVYHDTQQTTHSLSAESETHNNFGACIP